MVNNFLVSLSPSVFWHFLNLLDRFPDNMPVRHVRDGVLGAIRPVVLRSWLNGSTTMIRELEIVGCYDLVCELIDLAVRHVCVLFQPVEYHLLHVSIVVVDLFPDPIVVVFIDYRSLFDFFSTASC